MASTSACCASRAPPQTQRLGADEKTCLLDQLPLSDSKDVIKGVPKEGIAILHRHGPEQILFANAGVENLKSELCLSRHAKRCKNEQLIQGIAAT